jgi:hypothetical protein
MGKKRRKKDGKKEKKDGGVEEAASGIWTLIKAATRTAISEFLFSPVRSARRKH